MRLGHSLFRRKVAEQGGVLGITSSHRGILREGVNSKLGRSYAMGHPAWDHKLGFSAACWRQQHNETVRT
jgi:hypothetical protein